MKLYKLLIFREKINHLLLINIILFSIATTQFGLAQNADINLLKSINVDRNKSLDPSFKVITHSVTPISIGAPLVVFSVGLIQKDSTLKNKGIFLAETFLVNGFITTALKLSINRDRPFVTHSFIDKQTDAGSHSFPSGHTSTAFATATSLSLAFPKWYVITPSFLWASSVGYSRMHLGVHYPSDVLAGAFVGAGSAFLSYKLNRWITGKYSKKKTNKKML
jgi:membrane-associated phospholipid phosphatase